MNPKGSTTRRVMPWLAPLAVGGLYALELWREGLFAEPLMLLVQVALAAPLVLAGSVLLTVAEQEARAHTLTPGLQRWLVWTPRAVLLLFVAFLALLSLEVFSEGGSAGEIVLGLLMHNLPALGLLAITVMAWRWPWVGALGLAAFAAMVFSDASEELPSVFVLLVVLPLTVAALFLLSWRVAGTAGRQATAG